MQKAIRVCSISWIQGDKNPIWFSGKAVALDPGWVPKTYMGLYATRNATPPSQIDDVEAFRSQKNFRALTAARLVLDIDDEKDRINDYSLPEKVLDPGWTPPFRKSSFPLTVLRAYPMDWFSDDDSMTDPNPYAGELSLISTVMVHGRHENGSTMITIPGGETVVADSIIKFRAGSHTDEIGTQKVGAPWHVPWVWNEWVLTYAGKGAFKLYASASRFPSHAWYVNGQQVAHVAELGDLSFPSAPATTRTVPLVGWKIDQPHPLTIAVERLALYPILSKGASAAGGAPQAPDGWASGPIETHANTVSVAWPMIEAGTVVSGN
jgi:hypothetical protein